MRKIFTDGFNSFVHVGLGGVSAYGYPLFAPLFLGYQLITVNENTLIDLMEFMLGYVGVELVKQLK